jgi:hypothetical protein
MRMNCYLKHLKTVCKHKKEVFKECRACGIGWQGFIHDLSKFSWVEFASSARHFQGTRSPIEAEKESIGYSKAWLHHKGHNKHHWEYWTDFADDGTIIANKIPMKYVIEMICDWIGAGKVYSSDKWTQNEPLRYYFKVRQGRYFNPETEATILQCLHCISDNGLDEFHKLARTLLKENK